MSWVDTWALVYYEGVCGGGVYLWACVWMHLMSRYMGTCLPRERVCVCWCICGRGCACMSWVDIWALVYHVAKWLAAASAVVCIYEYMCVRADVYMYAFIYDTYMHTHAFYTCMCMRCTYTHVHGYIYALHIRMYIVTYTHMYTYLHSFIENKCTSIHWFVYTFMHSYIYTYAHTYIVHTYTVMHTHTRGCTRQRIWGWERGGKGGGGGGGKGEPHQPWVATISKVPKISGFFCQKALQS